MYFTTFISCRHARVVENRCPDARYVYFIWEPQMDFYFRIKPVTLALAGNRSHLPSGIHGMK